MDIVRKMDPERLSEFVSGLWDAEIVPQLVEYIRIPNKSPMFDAQWAKHGYMDAAVKLMEDWARSKLSQLSGATLEVVRLEGRTPLIYIEVPGASDDTVMLYGHLDKQPEMTGWADDLGPWTPVIKRQAVRPRRRRRWVRDLWFAGRATGLARAGRAACALRHHDRSLRRIRQL
jgi:acetylornithine deacetylase/succinyl-diaminopimelate desuccinylase-like protein